MKYYIAIDAGGNKTDSVLFDATGNVIAREFGRGANAFDIGPTEAGARICAAVDSLKSRLPAGEKLSAVFGSISVSYYYPEIQQRVARHVGNARCHMDSVVSSVMAPVLGKEDGVCLISGTGSYCCVREKNKHRFYIGSSGYMLDTGGSGYVLGQQALIASQREHEGRGPKTLITELVEKEMGETVLEHLPVIYMGGRAYISSFAHVVFNARAQGDAVAQKIFDDGVDYFAEALQTAYRHLGEKPFRCVLGGGIFLHHPEYGAAVRARAPQGCELITLETPAVYGGALEAIWLDGEEAEPGFRTRFMETYSRYPVQRAAF